MNKITNETTYKNIYKTNQILCMLSSNDDKSRYSDFYHPYDQIRDKISTNDENIDADHVGCK